MPAKPPASLGDALIFSVKWIGLCAALTIVAGIALFVRGDYAHNQTQRELTKALLTVANLGDQLSACSTEIGLAPGYLPRNLLRE